MTNAKRKEIADGLKNETYNLFVENMPLRYAAEMLKAELDKSGNAEDETKFLEAKKKLEENWTHHQAKEAELKKYCALYEVTFSTNVQQGDVTRKVNITKYYSIPVDYNITAGQRFNLSDPDFSMLAHEIWNLIYHYEATSFDILQIERIAPPQIP